MQNIALLVFWWLASNLELAYPSEVYCNLSLMIGLPVIDGGLQAAPLYPFTPPPSVGEGGRIFEMCFDHQSSQKALISYWPEMKGIRWKCLFQKAITIYSWCFVCLFFSFFKKSTLGYNKDFQGVKLWPLKMFKCFSDFLLGETRLWLIQIIHESLSSVSFHLPSPLQILPFSKQIQMLDNEWVEDTD